MINLVVRLGTKKEKLNIHFCSGIEILSSGCAYLNNVMNIAPEIAKIHYRNIYFSKPHLINKENSQGLMAVTTGTQSFFVEERLGRLLALKALCEGFQKGLIDRTYCKNPNCQIEGFLKFINELDTKWRKKS